MQERGIINTLITSQNTENRGVTVCLSISPVRLFYQYVTNLSVNLVSGVTEL